MSDDEDKENTGSPQSVLGWSYTLGKELEEVEANIKSH